MSALEELAAAKQPSQEELAAALDATREFIEGFVFASPYVLDVLAVFSAFTYVWDRFDAVPYLLITSPTRECGKTRCREVLEVLVKDPLSTDSITGAALARAVEEMRPTLILDEADGINGLGEEGAALLRSVLNAGYKRLGAIVRCEGREHRLRRYSVFCPKILVGIGEFLAPTTRQRCIKIRLHRKPREVRKRAFWLTRALTESAPLRAALERFAAIEPPEVEPLDGASDRYNEIAMPLLSVAAAAGPAWEQRVRTALLTIQATDDSEPLDLAERTLHAVAQVFGERGAKVLSSKEICKRLNEDTEGPWADLRRGQGVNEALLAKFLARFEIKSRTVRLADGSTPKGYRAEDVCAAANLYTPPSRNATPPPCNDDAPFSCGGTVAAATETPRVFCNSDRRCGGVAAQSGGMKGTEPQGALFTEDDREIIWRRTQ